MYKQLSFPGYGESNRPKTDKRTKGTLLLCPCPGADLARLIQGQSQCLKRVKVVAFGDLTLPPGLWLSVLSQLYLRYPVFSLPALSDLTLCCPWLFPPVNSIYDAVLLNKIAQLKSSASLRSLGTNCCFFLLYFSSLFSHTTSCCSGPLFLLVQDTYGFKQMNLYRRFRLGMASFICHPI